MHRQRHIFAVSDATGETCETLAQAALSQFQTVQVVLERVPGIRTVEQAQEVVRRAAAVNGVVIFTMVSPSLRDTVQNEGRMHGVPTLDVLGPILTRLSDVLEISSLAEPGLLRHLDHDYFSRIDAVDFAIKHDDGLGLSTLGRAEIVLVGASRTSKTPTSVYLSYRGWRTANVPFVLDMDLPQELFAIDQRKIVGLTVSPDVLKNIREHRQAKNKGGAFGDYAQLDAIKRELIQARRLFEQRSWPVIDTTHKSIEETATEVMRIIYRQTGEKKGHIADENSLGN